jgi:L-amino acid N-acyltransferase
MLNQQVLESPYLYMETPVTLDNRREWLASHRAAGLPIVVAADANRRDSIIGWGALSPYRPSSGYRFTAELSVYVAPAEQGRGIGGRLLSSLCDEAGTRGLHALVASIDSENAPSIGLFERRGFREVARLAEVGRKFDRWRTQLLLLRVL